MQNTKLNDHHLSLISSIFDNSLELKTLVKRTAPFYDLDSPDLENIKTLLINLNKNISSLSENLQIDLEAIATAPISTEDLSKHIIILNSKSIYKKLLSLGLHKNKLVFLSSPLTIEDFKIINPAISQSNIQNFASQIDKNWTLLKNAAASNPNLAFYFVETPDNPVNKLIKERIVEYFNIQKIPLEIINSLLIEKL